MAINGFEVAFNAQKLNFGRLFGQPFRIGQVDYTSANQTPSTKFSQKMYKVEVSGPSLVQNSLPNVSYYRIIGDYKAVTEGNVMFPLRSDSSTPIVTMLSRSPFEEQSGFRTSRICNIMCGEEVIYSNVYYDFASTDHYPGDSIHRMVLSNGVPESTLVMYKRNMRTSGFDTEGLFVKDLTDIPNVIWKIKQITTLGEHMLLTVSLSVFE